MSTDTIAAREREVLAYEAWVEITSLLELMRMAEVAEQANAIRGMVIRCTDLIGVMGLALDPEVMPVGDAWTYVYGRGHGEK